MKRTISIFTSCCIFLLVFSLQTTVTSCKKETIIHDTVTVVQKDTLTVVQTDTVLVHAGDTCTEIEQPHYNPNELHLFGNGSYDETDPEAPEFGAEAWTSGQIVYMRALLKFDMVDIPADAEIISAKLTLYSNPTPLNGHPPDANYGTNNAMLIQRITSPWSKSTKWNTMPSSTSADEVIVAHTNESHLDLIDVDITKLAQAMHSSNNYGVMLRLQNEQILNSRIFSSSRYPDYSKHPKLVVKYMKHSE